MMQRSAKQTRSKTFKSTNGRINTGERPPPHPPVCNYTPAETREGGHAKRIRTDRRTDPGEIVSLRGGWYTGRQTDRWIQSGGSDAGQVRSLTLAPCPPRRERHAEEGGGGSSLQAHVEIRQDGEQFYIKTSTTVRTTEINFHVGQEFDEETVDGRKCRVRAKGRGPPE